MAVAHDAATKSAAWTNTPNPFTFSHTPAGTPRGVVVEIIQPASGDTITSMTYGGVAMSRIRTAADTAGEFFWVYTYFLGASIPTGAQTVSITYTGSFTKIALCATVTAADDTSIEASGIAQENQANPQITVTTGTSALRYFAIGSGLPNTTDLTLIAGCSAIDSNDFGSNVGRWDRETSPSSGGTTVGYTAGTDDVAMIAVAVREGVAPPVSGGTISLLGVG